MNQKKDVVFNINLKKMITEYLIFNLKKFIYISISFWELLFIINIIIYYFLLLYIKFYIKEK
jgi:hypothetical protein